MFDIDTCVAFITNNAAKKIGDAFNDRLISLGTTRVQWIAIYYIGKQEGISQIELAEKMDVKAPTMARLIDRMERDDIVCRIRKDDDKRVVSLILTENGRELREKLIPEGEKISKDVADGLTEEEIEIFKKVLDKMVKNVI